MRDLLACCVSGLKLGLGKLVIRSRTLYLPLRLLATMKSSPPVPLSPEPTVTCAGWATRASSWISASHT